METKYCLAPGVQVREEDFGLLFYTMNGPKLYFFPTQQMLRPRFFEGEITLGAWLGPVLQGMPDARSRAGRLKRAIDKLKSKGVVIEC